MHKADSLARRGDSRHLDIQPTMITFYITTEERRRAQERAAELDIDKSDPPGRFPYVWDNRLNSVKRWYDYGSAEGKIGTVYFRPVVDADGNPSALVECTTEITRHLIETYRRIEAEPVTDSAEHEKLAGSFLHELLTSKPNQRF